jgi:hypothetical protein
MNRASNKFYLVSFIILFGISTAILLIASTAKTPLPAWGGYLDVGIVILIAFFGFWIRQRDTGTPRYDISHPVTVYLFPAILVGIWLYRDSLDFNILLPGLAWRTYFLLGILPHGLNLWKFEQHQ